MENRVYFYRIKTDECYNFAPCWDDELLSLACCKRDLRRVIGRQYNNGMASKDNPIWIVAVNGNDVECSQGINCIRYIAKITGVKHFQDYFSGPIYQKRKDCIYSIPSTPYSGESKVFWKWRKNEGEKHKDKDLQERDWDVGSKTDEKYVLLSEAFRFLTKEESQLLSNEFPEFTCDGVGHRIFSDTSPKCKNLIRVFESLISKGPNSPTEVNAKYCRLCNQTV